MALVNLLENPNEPSQDFLRTAWFATQGCTIRRSTKMKKTGTASLLVTGIASTAVTRSNHINDDYFPEVSVGSEYKAAISFSHDSIGREVSLGIIFYNTAREIIQTSTTFTTSASQSGTLVTLTTSTNHGLSSGQIVSLSGFATSQLNLEERVITVTGANTYTVIADDSATRSGSGGTTTVLHCYVSTTAMGYSDWTLATTTATAPTDATYATIQVYFDSIDTSSAADTLLFLDVPSLVSTTPPSSKWYSRMENFIPEYMKAADAEQTLPDYPLARFVDLVASRGQEILDIYDDINYISVFDGGEVGQTSALVDPSAYPDGGMKKEWLPWVAQLLATKSVIVPGGATSWSALAASYTTWDGWEDGINGASGAPAVSISAKSRTNGISTITTSSAHGLAVGDSVVISSAGTYNGVHIVESVASSTEFTFSQVMPLLSITRSGTTVTAVVGLAHNYSVADSIVIDGTNTALDGTFSVVSTSTTDDLPNVLTYTTGSSGAIGPIYVTGETYPANNSSGSGGSSQIGSDLTWTSIEQYAPYPFEPNEALAYLLRTGAAGVWAGTQEGLKRAARLPLYGFDLQATMVCSDGTMTITTLDQHTLTSADEGVTEVEIYGTTKDGENRVHTVVSVISANKFTVLCGPGYEELAGWVTSKIVEVVKGYWAGVPSTISTSGGVMTVTFNTEIPFSTTAAPVVISGTGNVSVDTTHNPASVTVAANRLSVSFPSAVSLGSPLTPSDARVRLVGNIFTFLVKTSATQTEGPGTVLAFADQAKGAGCAISHEYS